jgi:hypothetical protein
MMPTRQQRRSHRDRRGEDKRLCHSVGSESEFVVRRGEVRRISWESFCIEEESDEAVVFPAEKENEKKRREGRGEEKGRVNENTECWLSVCIAVVLLLLSDTADGKQRNQQQESEKRKLSHRREDRKIHQRLYCLPACFLVRFSRKSEKLWFDQFS